MRAALEAVAHFLGKYGALDQAKGVVDAMASMGYVLPEEAPLRYSLLLGTLRKELEDVHEPLDYAVLFDRFLQLAAKSPSRLCRALFSSPLFLHVLVERFEVTFAGISADIFRQEREDLLEADGVYSSCRFILDQLFPVASASNPLAAFLSAFDDVFHDVDDPKSRWTELHGKHRINDAAFRRDMMRALRVIESAAIGDTAIEQAFPASDRDSDRERPVSKIASRELLERKLEQYNVSDELWADLSVIHSIHPTEEPRLQASTSESASGRQHRAQLEEEQGVWTTTVPRTDADTTSSSEDEAPRPRRSRRARGIDPTPPDAESIAIVDADASSVSTTPSTSRSGQRKKRKRHFWSDEEKQAVLDGYAEFGDEPNVWVLIKAKHAQVLRARSNVDIKDKYRNLVKAGKAPRLD